MTMMMLMTVVVVVVLPTVAIEVVHSIVRILKVAVVKLPWYLLHRRMLKMLVMMLVSI